MATFTNLTVNLATNQVVITFDTAISSIDFTQVYALSSSSDSNRSLSLVGSTIISGLNTTTITLSLTAALLTKINSTPNLWQDTPNTYLLINATATSPVLGSNTTIQASTFTRNSTPPSITGFTFQPGVNAPWNLQLTMSIPCNVAAANTSNINLQSAANSANGNILALPALNSGVTLLSAGFTSSILLKLNSSTISSLTSNNICTSGGTTYLSCGTAFIVDRYPADLNTGIPNTTALSGTYVPGSNTAYPAYYTNSLADLRIYGGAANINNQAVITDGQANLLYLPVFTTIVTPISGTSYTATYNDSVITCSNANPVTINLPTITANTVGRTFTIKDVANSTRSIIINGNIDGNSSYTLASAYGYTTVICTSTTSWGRIA